jgi:hypothetical protein
MSMMYVVQWKSKQNGRMGRGTKLFEREAAEQLIAELNHEYPQIEHELVEVPPAAEPAPPPPVPQAEEPALPNEPAAPVEAVEHAKEGETHTVPAG